MIFFKLLKFYPFSKDKRRLPALYSSLTLPPLSFHAATYLIILPRSSSLLNPKIQHLWFNKFRSTIHLPFYVHLIVIFQSVPAFFMMPFFSFLSTFYVNFPVDLQDDCNIFGEVHSHETFNYAVFSSRPFLHLPWHRHVFITPYSSTLRLCSSLYVINRDKHKTTKRINLHVVCSVIASWPI